MPQGRSVETVVGRRHGFHGEHELSTRTRRRTQTGPQLWIFCQGSARIYQCGFIFRWHQNAGFTVYDSFRNATNSGSDDWAPSMHGFQDGQRQCLTPRRHDKGVYLIEE